MADDTPVPGGRLPQRARADRRSPTARSTASSTSSTPTSTRRSRRRSPWRRTATARARRSAGSSVTPTTTRCPPARPTTSWPWSTTSGTRTSTTRRRRTARPTSPGSSTRCSTSTSNRNMMTIDAFDWLHRTGANPPDDSADPAYLACASSQGQSRPYGAPRPHLYEGTFAHEYQHLLEYYASPGEDSWINEGLSDYAQTLVGYVDTNIAPDDPRADGHIGRSRLPAAAVRRARELADAAGRTRAGRRSSCDYGAAYTFMMYLYRQYGDDVHERPAPRGRQRARGPGQGARTSRLDEDRHADASTTGRPTMALDAALDKSRRLAGGKVGTSPSKSLSARSTGTTRRRYNTPGAPPNGSDYVRLRDEDGRYLASSELTELSFKGAKTLAPTPVEWAVRLHPAGRRRRMTPRAATSPRAPVRPALYCGCGENLDRSIVRSVEVPAGAAEPDLRRAVGHRGWLGLRLRAGLDRQRWQDLEALPTADTTSDHDPDAVPDAVDEPAGLHR